MQDGDCRVPLVAVHARVEASKNRAFWRNFMEHWLLPAEIRRLAKAFIRRPDADGIESQIYELRP